jgi:hypothetical protein
MKDFSTKAKPFVKELAFPKGSIAKICAVLNRKLLDKFCDRKTKIGGSISHIYNQALKFSAKEDIGLFMTDADVRKKDLSN